MEPRARQYIRQQAIFSHLPDSELQRVFREVVVREFSRGSHLIDIGEPTNGFFIVLSGVVVLTVISQDGNSRVIDIIDSGHSFGEALLFLGERSPVQAEMKRSGRVMIVPASTINRLIPENQVFARQMLSGLSARLHKLIFDIEACSLHRSRQRVVAYLLGRSAAQQPGNSLVHLILPVSKKIVASKLDLTPETFSRVLRELEVEGLVRVDGRQIEIPDRVALREDQTAPLEADQARGISPLCSNS